MLKHLFKLVWNRKRTNLLLIAEFFVSFIVLFAVVTFGTFYYSNYQQPLGFDYHNVLVVSADNRRSGDDRWNDEQREIIRQIGLTINEFQEVESSAGIRSVPYEMGGYYSNTTINNINIGFMFSEVNDGIENVLNIPISEGRWFNHEDDADTVNRAVVITQSLKEAIFGDENALGKIIGTDAFKVVGIIPAFKKEGELSTPEHFMFQRVNPSKKELRPVDNFAMKLKSGTPIEFEEKFVRRLQSVAKDWVIEANMMEQSRDNSLRLKLVPIYILGTIAGFLILMVTLGLLGVLWQNVIRRTSEIGLRRAMGASTSAIQYQIIGEMLIIAFFGIFLASVLIIQVPLLGLIPFVSPVVFGVSFLLSIIIIFTMVFLSSWYPSHIATSLSPVEALHFE